MPEAEPPPAPPKAIHTLRVGDHFLHPAHGIGVVAAIREVEQRGQRVFCYVLRVGEAPELLVPMMAAAESGLCPLMTKDEVASVVEVLRAAAPAPSGESWSARFTRYAAKAKGGSGRALAEVVRDLSHQEQPLSSGDRRLRDHTRSLLVRELALVRGASEELMDAEIDDLLSTRAKSK